MILTFQTVRMISLAKAMTAVLVTMKFLVAVKAFQAADSLLSPQTGPNLEN